MYKDKKLNDLFYDSKNKSIKWKKYFPIYENLFNKYRNKKITFVEIGILDGGSLEIWKKYFGEDARIIGIDNNPECKKFDNPNFEIYIGSQSDKNFWRQFYNKVGKVDIILDDGGHTNDQQIISLTESVNNINNGGLYVAEDVHTSYLKHYGNPYKYSFVNFTKKLIDDINFTYPNLDRFNYSLNKSIYSIQYFESMVAFFVDRNLCEENTLIENNGFSSGNHDTAIDEIFFKFRKKYNILYKFKFIKKIERFFIIKSLRKNSRKLKRYFK
jgi:hypothetical protein